MSDVIREFRTVNFRVVVDAIAENDLDISWDDDGSVKRGLETGELIAFCARARVYCRGSLIACDYLGNCIYKSLEDFADHRECGRQNRELAAQGIQGGCGSYFADMIRTAISEARKHMVEMCDVHIRH